LNYLWETLLAAKKENISAENLHFSPAATLSPYIETAFNDLNLALLTDGPIEVNAWYRFAPIFEALLDGEMDDHLEIRDRLFDVFMHLLGWTDLRTGLCRNEYYGLFLKQDLQNGKFGKWLSDVMALFPYDQRRFVTEHLVKLYTLGPSIELLRSVLRRLYPNSMLYFDTDQRRELLIYIGKKETPELARQAEFILSFFVPLDYIVHLFWNLHFGIIGVNETMEIDEIMVY